MSENKNKMDEIDGFHWVLVGIPGVQRVAVEEFCVADPVDLRPYILIHRRRYSILMQFWIITTIHCDSSRS